MKKNRRHRNHGLQGLALLLSIVLLFVFMPLSVIAETLSGLGAEEFAAIEEAYELTALREECVKHFYVGGEKYTAVAYGDAVHRLDATGEWQEIDNTLSLQSGRYRTPDGRISLAANGAGELLEISEKGYTVGLAFAEESGEAEGGLMLQSIDTTAATVQNATREAVLEGDSTAVQYEKISRVLNRSSVQYAGLLPDTDVGYTLHGNDVTGRITLRDGRIAEGISLRLRLGGLVPSLDEAGNVILSDAESGEAVYALPAPTADTSAWQAAYVLREAAPGEYLLQIITAPSLDGSIFTEDFETLTPGGESNAAVVLSVGFVEHPGTAISGDVTHRGFISSEYYDADFRDAEELYFENDNIGYFRMNLPNLPANTTLVSAELSVWYSQSPPFSEGEDNFNNGMDYTIVAYKATAPWYSVDEWTYSIADADYSNFGLAYTPLDTAVGMDNDTYLDFDVTDAVVAWHGGETNHGFGFVCTDNASSFYFCNRELAPALSVTYTHLRLPDGVYFIQNQQFSTFLETSDTNVSVQNFEVTDAQKWKITYINDGYYEISNLDGTMVLTADGNTVGSGVSMQERESTLGTNQQWFISAGGGGYRFAPRSAYYQQYDLDRYYVCIGVGNAGSTSNVQMMTHTTQLTSERMWNLAACNNTVNVNVYYDHAYVIRYGSTTNSTNSTANAIVQARINGHMRDLQIKYLMDFGILITYSAPQLIACLACNEDETRGDVCATWASNHDPLKLCDCVSNKNCNSVYGYHHTNIDKIGEDLVCQYSPNFINDGKAKIFFIGHDFCYPVVQSNTLYHVEDCNIGGGCYKDYSVMLINRHYVGSKGDELHATLEHELQTLIHEFGHLFFAPDHYEEISNGYSDLVYSKEEATAEYGYAFHDMCIYGIDKSTDMARTTLPICAGCKTIIQNNADRYTPTSNAYE